ncbi:MAG: bifunctional UDP-sugar hydrolase/5'-nucleotidase [bacterium]
MKFFNRTLTISTFLILSIALWAAQTVSLTVLHTNDTHGHLMPFSYPSFAIAGSPEAALSSRSDIGGIARRATLANQIKKQVAKAGGTAWLVDAGDFCDGTSFSIVYHGEADVAAMNAAGYDFGTVGNHEFNNTLLEFEKVIGMAKYKIVCANAIRTRGTTQLMTPYVIRKVGNMKIGIFGLVTSGAASYPAAVEGVTISDGVDTARRVVNILRQEVDVVMLISHSGSEVDKVIAKNVPGIDVIVGGHSHTRLPKGEFEQCENPPNDIDICGTIIVQAFQWGGELGRLDLVFEERNGFWHVKKYQEKLLPITSRIVPDPKVTQVLNKYWKPISAKYGEVLGKATDDFQTRGGDNAEYNLVADAVRETFGTDFEVENEGGVRAPLPKGKITKGDLAMMDPFDNTVITFSMKGYQIKTLILKTQPAVSGLRYRLMKGLISEITINGQPLEDEKTYTGATNSFFAKSFLNAYPFTDTGKGRLDTLVNYVRKKGTISPRYDGRRVITTKPAASAVPAFPMRWAMAVN